MLRAAPLVCLFAARCAAPLPLLHPHASAPTAVKPAVASLSAERLPPRSDASAPRTAPEVRASDYLALGLGHYQNNRKAEAAQAFEHALSTGNLNNQGRALAYWHLFLAERDVNLQGPGAEALESFVTVAQLLIEDSVTGSDESGDNVAEFIDGFNVSERMLLGQLVLDALWARRDPSFGRTPDRPVRVRDAEAERLFVQLYRPCVQTEAPAVQFSAAGYTGGKGQLDRAEISCTSAGPELSFYFSTKN